MYVCRVCYNVYCSQSSEHPEGHDLLALPTSSRPGYYWVLVSDNLTGLASVTIVHWCLALIDHLTKSRSHALTIHPSPTGGIIGVTDHRVIGVGAYV